jgi:hypothetical protein
MNVEISEVTNREEWDALVNELGGHPMQLWGWGEVKATGSWVGQRLKVTAAAPGPTAPPAAEAPLDHLDVDLSVPNKANWELEPETSSPPQILGLAQVLVRPLPIPFGSLSYIPRGPVIAPAETPVALPNQVVTDNWGAGPGIGDNATREAVTSELVTWCKARNGGVGIIIEPDWPAKTPVLLPGQRPSPNPILYPHTLILDLTGPTDKLLSAMRKSTRYEIRKGERDGLDIRLVRTDDEVARVLEVYHATADRAGFGLHQDDYYLAVHRELGDASRLFAAYDYTGQPCAFAWALVSDTTAFLLYGGANEEGRRLRANAPVYWASIQDARAIGAIRYDLNGLLNDGISEFKRSFAKHEDELIGSIDVPYSPLYGLWNKGLPAVKQILRRLANS